MLRYGIERFEMSHGPFGEFSTIATSYVTSLVSNGFLARNGWSVNRDDKESAIWLSGTLCHDTALQDAQTNPRLLDLRHSLESHLIEKSDVQYFESTNSEDDHYCAHKKWESLMLVCDTIYGVSSVKCTECDGIVAIYRLEPSSELASRLWSWDSQYAAIDACWVASGEYELWAGNELFDIKSKLNKCGLEIAATMTHEMDCEVRYFLPTDEGVRHISCPQCGGHFQKIHTPQYNAICDKCKIVTQH
ncbi:MAG: DUF2310 family Zn-ribbon-containing protein [Phycisphaerales bacterium]|nr:DUF2310 family Zn-ribbon-containing protein [Phycisphaerales bacterium]